MEKRISLIISGQVQGVFFRAKTKKYAQKLGLVGVVENIKQGKVRVIAEGPREKLEKLLTWAREGVEPAVVDKVKFKYLDLVGEFKSFEIKR